MIKTEKNIGNFLNIAVIFEKLKLHDIRGRVLYATAIPFLVGVQHYCEQTAIDCSYLYLCTAEQMTAFPCDAEQASLIILGEYPENRLPLNSSCIFLEESCNMTNIVNILMQIFADASLLERHLNTLLNTSASLDAITALALDYFQFPVFIHDEYYNILSCPKFVEGVTDFSYNERTGKYMENSRLLNNFQTSPQYKNTLTTKGAQLWNSDFDDRSALYVNIWIDEKYKGRFIISLKSAPVTPAQFYEAEYFAEIIRLCILKQSVENSRDNTPLRRFIADTLNGITIDYHLLSMYLIDLDWNPNDRFVCGIVAFHSEEYSPLSVFSLCKDIEGAVNGCYTCYYNQKIYLLINLTKGRLHFPEVRMTMSTIIRESLLYMGVSNEFYSIRMLSQHLRQAEIALSYGQSQKIPSWYNEFKQFALRYWITEGLSEFSRETICSEAVVHLKKYDEEHGTELYLTLQTYVTCERNATLTAHILKIHRSTLPHRLERIHQLTKVNLDDFHVRLYLMMSFVILEEETGNM